MLHLVDELNYYYFGQFLGEVGDETSADLGAYGLEIGHFGLVDANYDGQYSQQAPEWEEHEDVVPPPEHGCSPTDAAVTATDEVGAGEKFDREYGNKWQVDLPKVVGEFAVFSDRAVVVGGD